MFSIASCTPLHDCVLWSGLLVYIVHRTPGTPPKRLLRDAARVTFGSTLPFHSVRAGVLYYATVRATNGAGLSATYSSNGVRLGRSEVDIDPELGGTFMLDVESTIEATYRANLTGYARQAPYVAASLEPGTLNQSLILQTTHVPHLSYLSMNCGRDRLHGCPCAWLWMWIRN